jgi:hypothetical protein
MAVAMRQIMTKKQIKCSICGGKIPVEPISKWARGNNAQPVNDGRCCNGCNALYVIPARLAEMSKAKQ